MIAKIVHVVIVISRVILIAVEFAEAAGAIAVDAGRFVGAGIILAGRGTKKESPVNSAVVGCSRRDNTYRTFQTALTIFWLKSIVDATSQSSMRFEIRPSRSNRTCCCFII